VAGDYRGIRGSAELTTRACAAEPELVAAEALAPGEMRRIDFRGELLGAARIRSRFAALPFEAFDRAGEVLSADEQGAYFQLLRLAYGEGRNFCRVAKRELQTRLRLSERRLHRVLDGLVATGFVRPLQRDNRGTLWRVYLPREAFHEPLGEDVLLGRPATPARGEEESAARHDPPARRTAPVVALPRSRTRTAATQSSHAVAVDPPAPELAQRLASARGAPGALEEAEAEIAELLADGASPGQIDASIRALEARSREGQARRTAP
jgi:hypothetical protein